MYRVRDITDATDEEYEGILDEEMIQNLDREYFRGIAAFDRDDVVKGVLIWCKKNVDSDEDIWGNIDTVKVIEKDCLSYLASEYVKIADGEDYVKTVFEFRNPDKETIEAFKDNGFEIEEKESDDVIVTLADVEALKNLNKKTVKNDVLPINDIDMLQFRKAVSNCVFKGKYGIEEDISMLPKKWFVGDISGCIMKDALVTGLFLVHEVKGGELRPELMAYLGDDAEKHILEMMRFSAGAALLKYDREKEVVIKRHNKEVATMLNYLFPGKKGTTVTYGERKR